MKAQDTVPKVLFASAVLIVETTAVLFVLTNSVMYKYGIPFNRYFGLPVNGATLTLSIVLLLIISVLMFIGIYAMSHPKEL